MNMDNTELASLAGVEDPFQPPPKRGWWKRNWLWFVPSVLVLLAVLSLGGGAFQVSKWLEPAFPAMEAEHNPALVFISVAAGLAHR